MKRRSGTKEAPPDRVYFTDRTVGPVRFPEHLRRSGLEVEVHDDHFPRRTKDAVWIPEVAKQGWVIITEDQDLRYNAEERDHIMAYGAQVFVLRIKDGDADELARAFLEALPKVERMIEKQSGRPFIAKIYRDGSVELWLSFLRWKESHGYV